MGRPWYQVLFGRSESKDVAKERLKLVLLHDRNDLSPQLLNRIKDDIVSVLDSYLEIDSEAMDVELTRYNGNDNLSAFVANIPITSVKDSKRY